MVCVSIMAITFPCRASILSANSLIDSQRVRFISTNRSYMHHTWHLDYTHCSM
ncbi:hypothetical protein Hanom_Chr15g01404411 [Helianthus anomalus]